MARAVEPFLRTFTWQINIRHEVARAVVLRVLTIEIENYVIELATERAQSIKMQ